MSVAPAKEFLEGSVERVTYHNSENGYCVLKVKSDSKYDEPVTLVGYSTNISEGEFIHAEGVWTNHKDFGKQFKADTIRFSQPSTADGIQRYLGSGLIKGIGPSFAAKLVHAFGTRVFEVIEKEPHRLKQISGLGRSRIERLTGAWKEQRAVRDIMIFLQSHGVSTSKAVRIYKTYGDAAIERVKENPYQLAHDVNGIGFKGADKIASNLGIGKDSLIRARAGVHYMLDKKSSEGHCALPLHELADVLQSDLDINDALAREAIGLEVQEGNLVCDETTTAKLIFLPPLFRAECSIAKELFRLSLQPVSWPSLDISKMLPRIEKKMGVTLAPLQKEAVARALSSKVLVVTGGPGTGKTTLTKAIVSILAEKQVRMALCSPTGRAAKRLSECTGREAKTIHRLLGYDPASRGFLHDRQNPLAVDLVILDEASMVDLKLMSSLLVALPDKTSLLLVGDVDQIPSVGPGTVLQSLLESGVVPAVRLGEIYRQAAESRIIAAAHEINQGKMPGLLTADTISDFYFIECAEAETVTQRIIQLVKERIPLRFGLDSVKDIQVLCPIHGGPLGARALNVVLQKTLNPEPRLKVEKHGWTFSPGDKVMVTVNDYDKEVFNGDIGFVSDLDLEERFLEVDFDGRRVLFEFSELDILQLAFATTIHKSQGSEYPAVVIPITTQHYMMLKKNLIYTAVTRGKKLVVMVGQKRALSIAVHSEGERRWGRLSDRLVLTKNGTHVF